MTTTQTDAVTAPATETTAILEQETATLLLAAMDALKSIADAAAREAWLTPSSISAAGRVKAQDYGRLSALADVASDAIFDVFNTANAYCGLPAARDALDRRLGAS